MPGYSSANSRGLLVQQLQFSIVEIEKFPVHGSQPVDLDLAAVELDVGDEFDRNVDRLAAQVGVDDEADLQLVRLDRCMSRADLDRVRDRAAAR